MERQLRSATATPMARCEIVGADGSGALAVDGDLDVATSMWVAGEIRRVIDDGDHAPVAVDLSRVRFIDASGLGALVEARNAARARGCQFRVVDPSPAVRRLVDLTETAEVFDISASA